MAAEVIPRQSPEERELDRKRAELAELKAQLADRELQLATLKAQLHAFERRYVQLMSARYAELDDVNARIAGTSPVYTQRTSRLNEKRRGLGARQESRLTRRRPASKASSPDSKRRRS